MAAFSRGWRGCAAFPTLFRSSLFYDSRSQIPFRFLSKEATRAFSISAVAQAKKVQARKRISLKEEVSRSRDALYKQLYNSSPAAPRPSPPAQQSADPTPAAAESAPDDGLNPAQASTLAPTPNSSGETYEPLPTGPPVRSLPLNPYKPEPPPAASPASAGQDEPASWTGGVLRSAASPLRRMSDELLDAGDPVLLYRAPSHRTLVASSVVFAWVMFVCGGSFLWLASADVPDLGIFVGIVHAICVSMFGGVGIYFLSGLAKRVKSITLVPVIVDRVKGKVLPAGGSAGGLGHGQQRTWAAAVEATGYVPFRTRRFQVPLSAMSVAEPFSVVGFNVGMKKGAEFPLVSEAPWFARPFVWFGNQLRPVFREIGAAWSREPFVALWLKSKDKGRWKAWHVDVRGAALKGAEGFDYFIRSRS